MHSLYALHGFLGTPKDWEPLKLSLSIDLQAFKLQCPQTTKNSFWPAISAKMDKQAGFWQWAQNFNAKAARNPGSRILLGYSLGGRLALHALLHSPHLWKGGILISVNPGLKSTQDKAKRVAIDAAWAASFQTDPWDTLMARWNSQKTFTSSASILRLEASYSRLELSRQLQQWSLGLQDNLRHRITHMSMPILWMVGENDSSYVKMAEELHFAHLHSKIWIAPKAGHRLPWDTPEAFHSQVAQFIDLLKRKSR